MTPVKKFSSMTVESVRLPGSPSLGTGHAVYQYNAKTKSKFELKRFDCTEAFSKFDQIVEKKVSDKL